MQPVNLMQDFLRLARANTQKNLETCGVLAGSLVIELNFLWENDILFLLDGCWGCYEEQMLFMLFLIYFLLL